VVVGKRLEEVNQVGRMKRSDLKYSLDDDEAGGSVLTHEATVASKKISAVVFLKIATYPFLVVSAILVPRIMDPTTYGEYALLISIIVITTSVLDLGVDSTFARFVPEFETRRDSSGLSRLYGSVLAFKILIDLLAAAALIAVLYWMYHDRFTLPYILLVLVIVVIFDLGMVPFSVLFGLNHLGRCALTELIKRSLGLALVVTMFIAMGLLGAVIGNLLTEAFIAGLLFFWTRHHLSRRHLKIDFSFLKPYFAFGLIFYVSYGLSTLLGRLGNPLIEYLTNDSREVALFDIANQIFMITVMFTSFLPPYLIPMLTQLLLTDKEPKLLAWSGVLMKYSMIFCMLAFLAFVIAGRDLLAIVIGPEYSAAFPNAVLLLMGVFPAVIVEFGFLFAMVYKKPDKSLVTLSCGIVTFAILSFLLIPGQASKGCAIATLVSYSVMAIVSYAAFRRQLTACLPGVLKTMLLGLAWVPLVYLRNGAITNIGLGFCVVALYVGTLFASGVLRLTEMRALVRAVRSRSRVVPET
jgi:O-antigen/teichoic acid export membrane protein